MHEEITPGGNGHGCGHCALGTAALGAAAAAKEYMEKHQIQGTIKYFGCPAEEAGWGKMFLARDGYFDGLDAIYTWHPGTANMIWSAGCLPMSAPTLPLREKRPTPPLLPTWAAAPWTPAS